MRIESIEVTSDEARRMYATYLEEIVATFGYNSTQGAPSTDEDFAPPRGQLLAVYDETGTPVGCGAVRLLPDLPGSAEIKRMWLSPVTRGQGIGRRLLAALETEARALGATRAVLDTNEALTAALALYRNAGWHEVPAYNDNREATHWFAKDL